MTTSRSSILIAVGVAALAACAGSQRSTPPSPVESPPQDAAKPASAPSTVAMPPAPAPPGPVGALAEVGKTVNDGMRAFLGGKSLASSFPAWETRTDDEAKLRSELVAAGAASVVALSMEVELVFVKDGKDAIYVRTNVLPGEAAVRFAAVEGREVEGGKLSVTALPLDDFSGPGAPFRTAAEALTKALRAGECAKLEFAGPKDVDQIVGSAQKLKDELARMGEVSKKPLPDLCKRIAALGSDKVRLRIDDLMLVARGKDSAFVGMLKTELEAEKGKIVFKVEASRFRADK